VCFLESGRIWASLTQDKDTCSSPLGFQLRWEVAISSEESTWGHECLGSEQRWKTGSLPPPPRTGPNILPPSEGGTPPRWKKLALLRPGRKNLAPAPPENFELLPALPGTILDPAPGAGYSPPRGPVTLRPVCHLWFRTSKDQRESKFEARASAVVLICFLLR